jgi:twitching motility protein PilT
MSLGSFLLKAVLDVEGHALVIDTAVAPYVVTDDGPIEVATGPLSINVIEELLTQLLPPEARKTLDRLNAVETELYPIAGFPGEHFTLIAVRAGPALRIEISRGRRSQPAEEDSCPSDGTGRSPARALRGPASAASARPDDGGELESVEDASRIDAGHRRQLALPRPEPWRRRLPPLLVSPTAPPLELFEPMALPPASGIARLLRLAAGCGASILYVASGAQPAVRVDGDVKPLEGEPWLDAGEAESLILAAMPRGAHNALRIGTRTEWISLVPEVGRVRCLSFRDLRGATGAFRLTSALPASVEQLGLPDEVRGLALEPEGLVLIAGSRTSGKGTLIAALVDLINRTRRVHVITLEHEIQVTHDPQGSMISQREIRGDAGEQLAAARFAVDEDPDVLVIEDLSTDEIAQLALDAALGRLVIAGLSAHTVADAIETLVNKYRSDQRRRARLDLAERLRGSVAQTSVAKIGGGRVIAREVLLGTPDVAQLIAAGTTPALVELLEADESAGMISLNQALADLVRSGDVDVREAHRHSRDRQRLLALLSEGTV